MSLAFSSSDTFHSISHKIVYVSVPGVPRRGTPLESLSSGCCALPNLCTITFCSFTMRIYIRLAVYIALVWIVSRLALNWHVFFLRVDDVAPSLSLVCIVVFLFSLDSWLRCWPSVVYTMVLCSSETKKNRTCVIKNSSLIIGVFRGCVRVKVNESFGTANVPCVCYFYRRGDFGTAGNSTGEFSLVEKIPRFDSSETNDQRPSRGGSAKNIFTPGEKRVRRASLTVATSRENDLPSPKTPKRRVSSRFRRRNPGRRVFISRYGAKFLRRRKPVRRRRTGSSRRRTGLPVVEILPSVS